MLSLLLIVPSCLDCFFLWHIAIHHFGPVIKRNIYSPCVVWNLSFSFFPTANMIHSFVFKFRTAERTRFFRENSFVEILSPGTNVGHTYRDSTLDKTIPFNCIGNESEKWGRLDIDGIWYHSMGIKRGTFPSCTHCYQNILDEVEVSFRVFKFLLRNFSFSITEVFSHPTFCIDQGTHIWSSRNEDQKEHKSDKQNKSLNGYSYLL